MPDAVVKPDVNRNFHHSPTLLNKLLIVSMGGTGRIMHRFPDEIKPVRQNT
ncbi:hypothetical protein SD77_2277 [Bacillus badius]|uniref:Uncharacterized protein n=1 Tax=Bacillus badius TaxID=1455 RepID=A0ABR5AYK7_BACBA|nr:hypothetical protein SD78_2261 [Bacillus badius]KIL79823.1 hypothetical protein SD77_2277 [Bacillus badius]